MLRVCAVAILFAFQAFAQQSQTNPQPGDAAPAGLENDWDVAPLLQEIAKQTDKLLPALDKVDARAWINNGASETYAEQVQRCRDMAKNVGAAARDLSQNPEQLAALINMFIRMENLHVMLLSVEEGTRKYQTAADAQALAGVEAEGSASRERFQRYIISLAAAREQDLKTMDEEAQRCRGLVTAPPASAKTIKKK